MQNAEKVLAAQIKVAVLYTKREVSTNNRGEKEQIGVIVKKSGRRVHSSSRNSHGKHGFLLL